MASLSRKIEFFGFADDVFDDLLENPVRGFPASEEANSWYVSPCAPESFARDPPTVRVLFASAKAESFAFFCFIKFPSKSSSSTSRTSSPAYASPALRVLANKSICASFVEYMSWILSFSPIKSGTILNA